MLLSPMVHGLKAVHIYYLECILIFLSHPLFHCQVLCLEIDTIYWLPKDYLGDQHHEIAVLPRTVFLLLLVSLYGNAFFYILGFNAYANDNLD